MALPARPSGHQPCPHRGSPLPRQGFLTSWPNVALTHLGLSRDWGAGRMALYLLISRSKGSSAATDSGGISAHPGLGSHTEIPATSTLRQHKGTPVEGPRGLCHPPRGHPESCFTAPCGPGREGDSVR